MKPTSFLHFRAFRSPFLLLALTPLAAGQIWERCTVRDSWSGEAAGDSFGWVGENAGDVDGDGVDDVIVGAPGHDGAATNTGRCYVYSGIDASVLFVLDGSSAMAQLGKDVGAAGDVDGDGFDDVIVGGMGEVRVHLGPAGAPHLALTSPQPGDQFGVSVSTAGDVDGDGLDDLIVGAPGDDSAGANAGRVYVLSGVDGSVLFAHDGEASGDLAGSAVGFLKDRDGDGFADYIYGARNAGVGGRGRAYVHTGVDGSLDCVIDADATGVDLGLFFIGWCGDPTADGVPDFFVADWSNTANGPGSGRVYVFSGADCSLHLTLTGEAGDGFGIGRGWAGDYDRDGHDDLFFGSWLAPDGGAGAGKGTLHSGLDGSLLATWTGNVAGANLGFDAAGMGDVDGDGWPDFLLTAASEANGAGTTHLVVGGPTLPTWYCTGKANSTGQSAELIYKRTISASANELRLRVRYAVPGQTAIFFYGEGRGETTLGGGTLCVSNGLYRLGAVTLSAKGAGFLDLDFTTPPLGSGPGQVLPGTSWGFQVWYRDPGGPGNSNLSSALRLTFCD